MIALRPRCRMPGVSSDPCAEYKRLERLVFSRSESKPIQPDVRLNWPRWPAMSAEAGNRYRPALVAASAIESRRPSNGTPAPQVAPRGDLFERGVTTAMSTTPATPPTPRPGFRIEKDPLGFLEVPDGAYYGVQTARSIHNFPISGALPHPALVRAIVQVKKAAARANMTTGRLPKQLGNAIVEAANEILGPTASGAALAADDSDDLLPARPSDPMKAAFEAARAAKQRELIDNFRIDPFQAGAGTSHNMNANEVLANRAIELLHVSGVGSGARGDYAVVSPNDHVNMAQSTNDVFPTSMRIATLDGIRDYIPAAEELIRAFEQKAQEIDDVIKS